MTALHSQRNCWCGERHETMENIRLNVEHLKTVEEAAILGPYEEELSQMLDECPCGKTHPQLAALITKFAREIKVTVGTETWLVPRIYIAAHGLKRNEIPTLAEHYRWKKVGND